MVQVIDAVGHSSTNRFTGKIVDIDPLRLLTPNLTGILKIAHQFLFLGIHTEPRLAQFLMVTALFQNIFKLAITVRMRLTFSCFGVDPQTVVVFLEQAANHRLTDPVSLLIKTRLNINQTTIKPFAFTHGITRRMGRNHL
jgi:hypothetical protein